MSTFPLIRRLLAALGVVFCVVTLTFFLIRISPGGPFDGERKIPPAIEKKLLERYELDGPLLSQYAGYIADLLRGDLRLSTKYRNRSVNEILAQTLPVTLILGASAFLVAVATGVFLGTAAAVRRDGPLDWIVLCASLAAISLPSYITGPLLVLVFALGLGWFPVGGWGGVSHLVLPTLTLAAPAAAVIARLMRNSLGETLRMDFIRTARAKGLGESAIVVRHALRIAILPVVTYSGPLAAHLLTGSIVVETVFQIPGAGGFFVQSILNRDGFLLGGMVIVYCGLLVLFNLMVDAAYSQLDRRIQSPA